MKMKIEIIPSPDFKKAYKRLKKRYRSIKSNLDIFEKELLQNPNIGDDLGKGVHKIRVAIKTKGKGKSGGARVISHNTIIAKVSTHRVLLLTMYDKKDKDNITDKEIISLLKKNGII